MTNETLKTNARPDARFVSLRSLRIIPLGLLAYTVSSLTVACSGDTKSNPGGAATAGTLGLGSGGQAASEGGGAGTGDPPSGGTHAGGLGGGAGTATTTGGAGGSAGLAEGGSAGQDVGPPPDKEPTGIHVLGQQLTTKIARVPEQAAPIGGTVLWDTCPEGQALIGFDHIYLDFINGLVPHCGTITLTGTPGAYSVTVGAGAILQTRGAYFDNPSAPQKPREVVHCDANQVLVGFEGKYNDWIRKLQLTCAPLIVTGTLGSYQLELGPLVKLTERGLSAKDGRAEIPAPYAQCPQGMIARGTRMNAGSFIEALTLTCGKPTLTHPEATACGVGAVCDSGSCVDKKCAKKTCSAPTGCVCTTYETKQYVMCPTDLRPWSDAQTTCSLLGMHLIYPDSGAENGWARNVASSSGFVGPVWIGATDSADPDNWKWTNNVQVPFALQEGKGTEALWRENEPQSAATDPSNAQACAKLLEPTAGTTDLYNDRPGAWDDIPCSTPQGYICEKD